MSTLLYVSFTPSQRLALGAPPDYLDCCQATVCSLLYHCATEGVAGVSLRPRGMRLGWARWRTIEEALDRLLQR